MGMGSKLLFLPIKLFIVQTVHEVSWRWIQFEWHLMSRYPLGIQCKLTSPGVSNLSLIWIGIVEKSYKMPSFTSFIKFGNSLSNSTLPSSSSSSNNKKRNGYSSRTLFNSNFFFSIWKETKQSVKITLTRHFELKWNTRSSMSFISNDTLSKLTTVTIFRGHSKLIEDIYSVKSNIYTVLNMTLKVTS